MLVLGEQGVVVRGVDKLQEQQEQLTLAVVVVAPGVVQVVLLKLVELVVQE